MPALVAANAFVVPVRPQILPRTAPGGAAGAASSAQGSLTAGVVFALAGLSLARPVSGKGISHSHAAAALAAGACARWNRRALNEFPASTLFASRVAQTWPWRGSSSRLVASVSAAIC